MKLKKEVIIIGILLIVVCAFITAIIIKETKQNKYLVEINYSELKAKINNKESFILYIGKEGCSHCQKFSPKFIKILSTYKITAYHLNLTQLDDKEYEEVSQLISFSGTPTVVFIIDGADTLNNDTKIVGNISESKIIEKLKNRGYIK